MTFATRMMTGLGLVAGIGLMAPGLAAAQQTMTPPPAAGSTASATPQNGTSQNGMAAQNNTGRVGAVTHPGMQSNNTGMMSGNDSAKAGEAASAQDNNAGQSNLDPKTVMQVQQALNVKSDGKWGPHTEAALKQYQEKNGLSATGQLDQQTRAKLNLQS